MSESEPFAIPEVFGRYRILGKVGQGGMGAVFIAHDTQLDRKVALKVPFLTGGGGKSQIERFHREAKLAANFHHPNLCPVYDVGKNQGLIYFTMPLITGRSLAATLQRFGTLPVRQAVSFAKKIAHALAVAHDANVIHRDLKPGNIMIDERGEPVVMDFGLALRNGLADRKLTSPGAIVGTPAYMSPEQISGKETPAATWDVYSLGVILYQMLTGKPPYGEDVTDVIVGITTQPPKPPSADREGIDPLLDAICLKAMCKIASERYSTMQEFATDLSRFLDLTKGDKTASPKPRWTGHLDHAEVPTKSLEDRATEALDPISKKTRLLTRPNQRSKTVSDRPTQNAVPWIAITFAGMVLLAVAVWFLPRGDVRKKGSTDEEKRQLAQDHAIPPTRQEPVKPTKPQTPPADQQSNKVEPLKNADDAKQEDQTRKQDEARRKELARLEELYRRLETAKQEEAAKREELAKKSGQEPLNTRGKDSLLAKTTWSGTFKFLPPIEDYSGEVHIAITERNGEQFRGRYSTENGKYEWKIAGTLKGNDIKWEFTEAIKDNDEKSVVRNAHFIGTLNGDSLTGKFLLRNSNNKAELQLTREAE